MTQSSEIAGPVAAILSYPSFFAPSDGNGKARAAERVADNDSSSATLTYQTARV